MDKTIIEQLEVFKERYGTSYIKYWQLCINGKNNKWYIIRIGDYKDISRMITSWRLLTPRRDIRLYPKTFIIFLLIGFGYGWLQKYYS